MKTFLLSDVHTLIKIHETGILDNFDSDDISFVMTDFVYFEIEKSANNKLFIIQELIKKGLINRRSISDLELIQISKLFSDYEKKFILSTVSSLFVGNLESLRLITNCESLKEVAICDFALNVASYKDVMIDLVIELSTKINLSVDEILEYIK